ncbi:DUF1543 domain-containing protein [Acinetobacter sp. MD2]|uniref:DUF1543 domain-containing protein n=1 Tax=Acinetobacter sp. MD2 TaxID=2600066 RepID=UPI002D1E5E3B|nr:DUF1543 domain-containing protein [Acinetobacter sp. MD2]MEB3766565.1 DUF1543 domain-containing protein [Acinetobacter sp. MD2]
MSKLNLYLVLLGGKHEQANIEVHDLIPVISTDIASAFPCLKQQWFGSKQHVHVDAWMRIEGVSYDGIDYRISFESTDSSAHKLKLFLINLGAYLPHEFGEIHKYVVVAGKNEQDAKAQGKLAIEQHWFKPHTDAIVDIDDCIALNTLVHHSLYLVEGEYSSCYFENDYQLIL